MNGKCREHRLDILHDIWDRFENAYARRKEHPAKYGSILSNGVTNIKLEVTGENIVLDKNNSYQMIEYEDFPSPNGATGILCKMGGFLVRDLTNRCKDKHNHIDYQIISDFSSAKNISPRKNMIDFQFVTAFALMQDICKLHIPNQLASWRVVD